jgi:hypothetical protein
LISNGNFCDPQSARFQRLSASDWSILEIFRKSGVASLVQEKTVSHRTLRTYPWLRARWEITASVGVPECPTCVMAGEGRPPTTLLRATREDVGSRAKSGHDIRP